ncbi:non-ribosomal peptide synthetase [Acidicapsa ligni]|uniref:non-ribosomal peptide synthetase n=1 Tax=Acidicapsa ligni TaxID=542300 RepID=UPI0021DFE529|nr:amino acid adenylation domain-containing protein [Acidicapsa ligni]
MKSLIEFLSDTRSLGITLGITEDRLVCNAPKGVVTAEIRQELADRKADILAFLRQTQRTTASELPSNPSAELPLSHSQQRLWFFTQLDPDNPVYNVVISIWLNGQLNREALERSLRSIVERHDSLRTGFYGRNGQPFAQIKDISSWKLSNIDLTHLNEEEAKSEAGRLARIAAREPFRLDHPPLFRASLFQVSSQRALLVVAMHHIVSDGWSLGILSQELTQLYAAFVSGQPSPLATPSFQFQDYVRWEQEAGRKAADRQLPFWLERLSGELPVLELPCDRPRPAIQTFNGNRIAINIEEPLAQQLRELSRVTGTTVFMIFLAAFQTLLYRYTGVEDILVGSSTSNRPRQEFTTQVGFFVNNLVLRGDLSGNPTFTELLKRIQETATSAFAHQNVPFERLVEALHPERALSHNPLVQAMFNFQNLPMPELHFAALTAEIADIDPGIARADLNLEIWPRPQGYRCDFEYSTDLFDEITIRQMQRHFVRIIEAAVANPMCHIGMLPLLSDFEDQQLIEDWNNTATPAPQYATVPAWFRAQAASKPTATAVVANDESMTYAELNERSDHLAAILKLHGIGREVIAGIYLSRSLNMVVALLAVLKAGGAYLPLDPAFPGHRIEFLLNDANVPLLLTESSLAAALPKTQARILVIDEPIEIGERVGASITATLENSNSEPRPEDLAYMIYTSGSTGTPKGTEITHGALVNLLASMLQEPGLRSGDTLLSVTTLSFDIAALEVFGPLVSGAKLVLATREQAINPQALTELLSEFDITILQATPSTWRMLVESGWTGKSNLRMWCGGEALSPDLAESLLSRGSALWNLYGPTETTIWSAAHQVVYDEVPILIGHPIANTQFYILDAFQRPTPRGVAGELYIAGDGVARGYWRQPELTEARFLPNPFAQISNSRMYRTGDLARYRHDGQVQLLGRTDQQIKLRGYRIELGEIEAVIERHPRVLRAAVVLNGQGASQRLVAYVKHSEDLSASELRTWLQQRLPEYMLPSVFITLSEFPLTPNGKIDRKKLPAPEQPKQQSASAAIAKNQMERTLLNVWSELLHSNSIRVTDNFFDLGGHSLLLMQVHAQLRQQVDPNLAVVDLFRYPTIESLAAHLEKRQ